MKLKRILILAAMVTTVAMVGCRTVSSEPPSSLKEPQEMSTVATETEVATEETEVSEAPEAPPEEMPEPPETTPDETEEDYFQSDDFILVNSPDFEPFEFSHINLMLEREGIDDINFFRHTKSDSIKVGKIGDIIVGQMQMDDDDIVWNIRIEKADDFINNTDIDLSTAEMLADEHESYVHGNQYISRSYWVDLTNFDELFAEAEVSGKLDLSRCHVIEINFVLNKTKSILYTFYSHFNLVPTGEDTVLTPVQRGPDAILKSDADYALEALN